MNFAEFKAKVQAGKEDKIKNSSFIYRWQRGWSVFLSWLLVKIWPQILPNYLSIFNVILLWSLFLAVLFLPIEILPWLVLGQLFLLGFTSVLDKMDGEIARYKDYFTQTGLYFDLVYHFSYAFIFYLTLGYYFAYLSGSLGILWLSIFVGLLSAIYHMLGKIRHHIKYKITLEGHNQVIKDWLAPNKNGIAPKFSRRIDYVVLFIYDWVWLIYILFWLLSIFNLLLAEELFLLHLLFTAGRLLYELLWAYPRYHLFKQPD